jgi:hypothetical protein
LFTWRLGIYRRDSWAFIFDRLDGMVLNDT